MSRHRRSMRIGCSFFALALLCGCQVEGNGAPVAGTEAFNSAALESVVGADCVPSGNADPRSVRSGATPCELVKALGRPKDVVVSALPGGGKRVSMFYPGSGGTTRSYTFIGDKLISTPPGELKANYAGRQ